MFSKPAAVCGKLNGPVESQKAEVASAQQEAVARAGGRLDGACLPQAVAPGLNAQRREPPPRLRSPSGLFLNHMVLKELRTKVGLAFQQHYWVSAVLGQARLLVAIAVLNHYPRFAARTQPAHISPVARRLEVQLPVPLAAVAPQLDRAGKALTLTTASAASCSMPHS